MSWPNDSDKVEMTYKELMSFLYWAYDPDLSLDELKGLILDWRNKKLDSVSGH